MPGAHRSREAKQLKTAGLITIAVASMLMMLWAVFPSAVAFAGSGTEQDPFSPGDKVPFCHYDGSDQGGGGSGKYNTPEATVSGNGPNGHGVEHSFDVIPSFFFNQHPADHPQFDPDETIFFPGVNWPTLNNMPDSPVDFTPLEGSSASVFIDGGCGEPTTSTSVPPCPSGTTTVTATTTTTVTQTSTVTVTSEAPSLLADTQGGEGGDRALQEGECETTTTETVRTTTGTTATTTVPFCPEGSTTTTVTETAPPTTVTVTAGDVANQQPAECTSTETTTTTPTETTTVTTGPPQECPSGTTTTTVTAPAETTTVTDTNTVTVTVQPTVTETVTEDAIAGGPNPAPGFDQPMQEGFCHETTTTTPTVTETISTNTTTTVTSPTTVTQTTTAPTTRVAPTTITPPDDTTPPETTGVNPTTVTPPDGTAFTGVENVIPLGTIALVLMTAGSGLLWAGSRRGRRQEDQD
jgi:hypothetical protein